jgi:hypothetical protein
MLHKGHKERYRCSQKKNFRNEGLASIVPCFNPLYLEERKCKTKKAKLKLCGYITFDAIPFSRIEKDKGLPRFETLNIL